MDIIDLNKYQLKDKRVLKKDKVWTDEKYVYKNAYSFNSKVEYLDIFYLLKGNEFENLTMPKYELYVSDKPYGYVTDYLYKYKSVREYLRKTKITYKNKLEIIKRIINTIKKMHNELEIVHGDLNPSNIMIKDTNIEVVDFDNMGIKGATSDKYYKSKQLDDMKCLTTLLFDILCETDINMDSELFALIDLMDVSKEFKSYLSNCLKYDDSVLGVYPDEYIKEINGTIEYSLKNKVRDLK